MYQVRYGGKRARPFTLVESKDLVVVRTKSRRALRLPGVRSVRGNAGTAVLSKRGTELLGGLEFVAGFAGTGVEIRRHPRSGRKEDTRKKIRRTLAKEDDIQFAGRVLMDRRSKTPVLYTENFFVKFNDDTGTRRCSRVLKEYGLQVKRQLGYARNAYFVAAPDGTGTRVFELAEALLNEDYVQFCHPELVRERSAKVAFAPQWHLDKTRVNGTQVNAHANVVSAWALSQGQGITIAVIDDGFDLDHAEFAGADKIVSPRDVTRQNNDPRPGSLDDHGTACAGVACANGTHGASGVAPSARLMPIRLASALGSQDEADAFVWAAQNGADVISCSWGPSDGLWWDPSDPVHNHVAPVPDSTRLALDFAVQQGRAGRGCVITWAAGNGNESVDNDGYASYEKVIAVAACNDQGKRSAYSDMGDAIWCAFPSSHGYPSLTPGIWTTDRTGAAGYNDGQSSLGDTAGNYANDFGGTSSSCPGAAGVAALVLSRNPNLRWDEVKDLLKQSCDRIDQNGGGYDASGHSTLYGYGRLNARKAVELATPAAPQRYTAVHTGIQNVPIRDKQVASLDVEVGDAKPVKSVKVQVDIEHTYVGDLIVSLIPPQAMGRPPIVLHNRAGGSADNLKKVFVLQNTPALKLIVGQMPTGTWRLEVEDRANQDEGRIKSWGLELGF